IIQIPHISNSPNLHTLILNDNRISAIPPRAFAGYTGLENLHISNNPITSLNPSSFEVLNNLTYLTLINANLTKLERAPFEHLNNLEILDVSVNPIVDIEEDAFEPLHNLKNLGMLRNNITKIDKRLFAGRLPNLISLDLSNNQLKSFENGTFDKPIESIKLEGNPIVCDESLDWFVQWLADQRKSYGDLTIYCSLYFCNSKTTMPILLREMGLDDVVCAA
ncbi:hypothetical protein PFISCL1PPCAC_988, partial [Pristionchus fissidentatus]